MQCDVIAEGISKAAKEVNVKLPVIVRLAGSRAKEAQVLLDKFSEEHPEIRIVTQSDFDLAAIKAVEMAIL